MSGEDENNLVSEPEVAETPEVEVETPEPETPEVEVETPEAPKPVSWETRRRIEETNKRKTAEAKAAAMEAELTALRAGQTPDPNIESHVQTRAAELLAQQEQKRRVDSWAAAGTQTYGAEKFNEKCNFLAELGAGDGPFMSILTDPDVTTEGAKIIGLLADKPEEAERILALSPIKMAVEIAKLGDKISKPVVKPTSKAPAPVKPAGGVIETGTRLDDASTPMEDWANTFLKTIKRS